VILAAFSLIVLLTLALLTSVALIVRDLAAEQRQHLASDDNRVSVTA